MIKEKTVFILGAGASMPYGFPSARQLRKEIIDNYFNQLKDLFYTVDAKYRKEDMLILDLAKQLTVKFKDSGLYSIDNFLARNSNYLDIGKMAIILFLLKAEANSNFNEFSHSPESDWYSYIYNKHLINELITPLDYKNFGKNNVEFITFNYDRSLEKYIYNSLLNSFEFADNEKVVEQISKINISHVYGSLGTLLDMHPQAFKFDIKTIEFGKKIKSFFELNNLINNIQLMIDDVNKEYFINIINKATRIFILGFGFDEMNLKKIDFFDALKPEHKIYATTKGLKKKFVENLKTDIIKRVNDRYKEQKPNIIMTERNLFFEDANCLELLETYL